MKKLIYIFLLVCAIASTGYSQWTQVYTSNIVPSAFVGYGNIVTYADGTVWRAHEEILVSSTNMGTTWVVKTPPQIVSQDIFYDVDFWDRNIGICTKTNQNPSPANPALVLLTTDGGATWTVIFTSSVNSGCGLCTVTSCKFGKTSNEIIVTSSPQALVGTGLQPGIFFSNDRGTTWTNRLPSFWTVQKDNPSHIASRRSNGEMSVLVIAPGTAPLANNQSYVAQTKNLGVNWTRANRGPDFDSWSLAIDSCQDSLLVVVNEDGVTTLDNVSTVDVSTNKGISWAHTNPKNVALPNLYYTGGLSIAKSGAIFVQKAHIKATTSNPSPSQSPGGGVIRSTDYGATWVDVGGPKHWRDSRTICAINRDTLFASDTNGNVFRYAAPAFKPDTLFLTPKVQIVCDSLLDTAIVPLIGCTASISNLSLVGVTPGDYRVVRTNLDSIIVIFTPKSTGLRTGTLQVTMIGGTVYNFPLRGTGVDSGYRIKAIPDSLFFHDSVLTCKTLTRKVQILLNGCVVPSLVTTQSVTGAAAGDYTVSMTDDSVSVTFAPKAVGFRRADAVITFADGKKFTIPLGGTGLDPGPAAGFKPTPGFANDQVLPCQSLTRKFLLVTNKCSSKNLTSQAIGGNAAGDYTLDDPLPDPLTGADSVTITFTPSTTGARNANYTVRLADGTVITLPLSGVGASTGGKLSATPPILFDKDTVLTCKSVDGDLTINTGACIDKTVAYQIITGAASGDYVLTVPVTSAPFTLDKATITFSPSVVGPRPALYTLVLTDSSRVLVPLQGTGKDPGQPLVITPPDLFQFDTVALCKSVTRGMRIQSNVCISPKVLVQDITGPGAKDYTLITGAPNPLTGDDSVYIVFTPSAVGQRAGFYTLTLPNGVTQTIPLLGTGFDEGYTVTPDKSKLFTGDNIERCKSITRSFVITSNGCIVPTVKDEKINGPAETDYQLKSAIPTVLTGSDTITITFSPGAVGARDADYILTLSDGKQITVKLEGVGDPAVYTVSVAPVTTLFDKDTVALCASLDRKFVITTSGCLIPTITGETMTGTNSSEYLRTGSLPLSYTGSDTVTITFSPTGLGKRNATYEITFSDGKKYTITLVGTGKNAVYNVTVVPDTLFLGDSLLSCEQIVRDLFVTRTGCAMVNLVSADIQGKDAADYLITSQLPTSLSNNEKMKVRFIPSGAGLRKASIVIVLDDGKIITVPLVGFGVPTQTVTLSTSGAMVTDTLGGDLAVPIYINGLTRAANIDMDVSFDKSLTYLGTTSVSGKSVDVKAAPWTSPARISIPAADVKLTGISAYAHFGVYADSTSVANVKFDNIGITPAPKAACQYITTGATTSMTVTGPQGCGMTEISNFMRNKTITLRIYPNPTPGTIMIATSHTLGETAISVTDAIGNVRYHTTKNIAEKTPAAIDLSRLPSGTYFVRVAGANTAVSIVIAK